MKSIMSAISIALLGIAIPLANAGEIRPVSGADLSDALVASDPVVLQVHAKWCPVCAKQAQTIETLMDDAEYEDITVLVVDFDNAKPTLKSLNVSRQSTLILFENGEEIDRIIGVSNEAGIREFLKSAVSSKS